MSMGMSDEFVTFDQRAVIKVCGVGGGGGNAVARMIEEGLQDVEFIAINTDAQALKRSPAAIRLQIGSGLTGGLGSGAKPEVGQRAADEDRERIADIVGGADMVFVTCGLGGGTGTGAAPIVADIARGSGALTVAIATLPFEFEGQERMENALMGLKDLEAVVDTIIVIPNDRVAQLCQDNISLLQAFRRADEVLHNGVRAISELITVPGLINVDFADVRTIMQSHGRALMGIGVASGEDRAVRAANEAIVCPLLEQSSIDGARAVIVNVKAGCDIRMREVQEAVATVQQAAHPEANIIFGTVVEEAERDDMQVTVIAAGFDTMIDRQAMPPQWRRNALARTAAVEISTKAAETEPVVPVTARKDGQVEYLFPQEQAAPVPAAKADADEDMGIPAYMRRRRRTS